MEKTIIIIGAGIAGLAAGCYAQMNGYRSQIFELHTLPVACAPPGSAAPTSSMAASITCTARRRGSRFTRFG